MDLFLNVSKHYAIKKIKPMYIMILYVAWAVSGWVCQSYVINTILI